MRAINGGATMRATTKSVVDLDTILDINAFSVDETLARLDREAAEAAAAAAAAEAAAAVAAATAAAAGAGAGAGGDAAHTHAHSHSHDDHDHTGDDCTHPSHAHAHGESSAAGEFSLLFCSFYRMTEYSCNLIILYMILIITIFSRKRPCAVASSARAARPFGLDVQRQPQRGALASAPYALARRDSVG